MRIIAGEFGSIRLKSLEGDNTRPTLDKVKEAIFSSIGTYFDGGKALDLFSGSGSLGLECISRGMDKAYLNDKNIKAIKIIKENINTLKVNDRVKVLNKDYRSALEMLSNEKFDFVYIDPPYALKCHEEIMKYLDTNQMINEDGVVLIESANEDVFEERYGSLEKYKEKIYGISRITYYRKGD